MEKELKDDLEKKHLNTISLQLKKAAEKINAPSVQHLCSNIATNVLWCENLPERKIWVQNGNPKDRTVNQTDFKSIMQAYKYQNTCPSICILPQLHITVYFLLLTFIQLSLQIKL